MTSSVIFGLDGVLANNQRRRHLIEKNPPDWRAFYDQGRIEEDFSNGSMIQLSRQLSEMNKIVIVTERPITVSEVTRRWLKEHGISYGAVITRQDRKHDCVAEYKIEMIRGLQREGCKPWLLIDCDPEVIRMAKSNFGVQGMLVTF